MKAIKLLILSLVVILLVLSPALASAHGGGRIFLGFGAGLLTGFLFAPRPVYVAPPVYVPPPVYVYPPVEYRYVPPPPPATEYSVPTYPDSAAAAPPPPTPAPAAPPAPSAQAQCREWKMVDRHWQDRWDPDLGKWRKVFIEKWDWVGAPCR